MTTFYFPIPYGPLSPQALAGAKILALVGVGATGAMLGIGIGNVVNVVGEAIEGTLNDDVKPIKLRNFLLANGIRAGVASSAIFGTTVALKATVLSVATTTFIASGGIAIAVFCIGGILYSVVRYYNKKKEMDSFREFVETFDTTSGKEIGRFTVETGEHSIGPEKVKMCDLSKDEISEIIKSTIHNLKYIKVECAIEIARKILREKCDRLNYKIRVDPYDEIFYYLTNEK